MRLDGVLVDRWLWMGQCGGVKVSKKSEYAICALTEMALQRRAGAEWLQIGQIATASGVPEKFLEQILLVLKKAGHLQSRRGMEGGYAFKIPPEQLDLEQVVDLLDGEVKDAGGTTASVKDARFHLSRVLEASEAAARGVLRGTSVAGLADQLEVMRSQRPGLDYHI
ncbi:MAG: Rrf2 family transcriptional regulator [Blastochloris sp.]|nr:Rrf2 family transcriptional regulator [Blastochloris sp.]